METATFIFSLLALFWIIATFFRIGSAHNDLYNRLRVASDFAEKATLGNHLILERMIQERSAAILALIRDEGERVCIVYGTGLTNLDPREWMSDEEKLLASMPSLGGEPANEVYEALRQRAIDKAARLSEPPKLIEYNLGTSSRDRMKKGDQVQLYIDSMVSMANIRLRTEEPFVIQDVRVGKNSMMMAYDNPAHREVVIQETVRVGNRITILVSWPA